MLVTVPVGAPFSVNANVVIGNPDITRPDDETICVETCPVDAGVVAAPVFDSELGVVERTSTVEGQAPSSR
jgi:hypothetical protein